MRFGPPPSLHSSLLLTGAGRSGGGGGFVGPLDEYEAGLKMAASLTTRLLSSYTGKLALVRADRTGQPTYEIGVKADGTWDTAGLLSFAGTDSVYLVELYKQYGAFQFAQPTAGSQPLVAASGALFTGGIKFSSGKNLFATLDASDWTGAAGTAFQLLSKVYLASGEGGGYEQFASELGSYINAYGGIYFDVTSRVNTGPISENVMHVYSEEKSGANQAIRVDGTVVASRADSAGSITVTSTNLILGDNASYGFNGRVSTYCIWENTTDAAGRAAALA